MRGNKKKDVTRIQIGLRIDAELRGKIEELAAKLNRNFSNCIETLLWDAVRKAEAEAEKN